MNINVLLTALTNVKTVGVKYPNSNSVYTYKTAFNHLIGEQVIVDSPSQGLTIVEVTELHSVPQLKGDIEYKWVVDIIDLATHTARLEQEKNIVDEITLQQNRVKAQEQLKAIGMTEEKQKELSEKLEKVARRL